MVAIILRAYLQVLVPYLLLPIALFITVFYREADQSKKLLITGLVPDLVVVPRFWGTFAQSKAGRPSSRASPRSTFCRFMLSCS